MAEPDDEPDDDLTEFYLAVRGHLAERLFVKPEYSPPRYNPETGCTHHPEVLVSRKNRHGGVLDLVVFTIEDGVLLGEWFVPDGPGVSPSRCDEWEYELCDPRLFDELEAWLSEGGFRFRAFARPKS